MPDEDLRSSKYVMSLVVYLSVLNEFLEKNCALITLENPQDVLSKTVKVLNSVVNGFETENNEFYVKCLMNLMGTLSLLICAYDKTLIHSLIKSTDWEALLEKALINNENALIPEKFAIYFHKRFFQKVTSMDSPESQICLTFFCKTFFQNLLPKILKNTPKSKNFFILINEIITTADENQILQIRQFIPPNMINDIITQLADCTADNQITNEDVLTNIFRFLNEITSKINGEPNLSPENPNQMLEETLAVAPLESRIIVTLLDNNLLPLNESEFQPQCNSTQSRTELYNFLSTFAKTNPELSSTISEFFKTALYKVQWRTNFWTDWKILEINENRKKGDYMGLKNLGCTCYMNSLFQQFFMVPEFRDYLIDCDVSEDESE